MVGTLWPATVPFDGRFYVTHPALHSKSVRLPLITRRSPPVVALGLAFLFIAGFALPLSAGGHYPLTSAPHIASTPARPSTTPPSSTSGLAVHAAAPAPTHPGGLPWTPHLGSFDLPGPHPRAWGPAGIPPGSQVLNHVLGQPRAANNSTPAWENRLCAGLWPWASNDSASQALYQGDCYGHDEPGVQFYSALPGSGGNVSWNVMFFDDPAPTENQSDLYVAIWFGLTLNDPLAWMDQCFLELQFYPDQTFYNPGPSYPSWTVNGAWIGAAVAWQIEDATGYEDPCFYQPLYNGSATGGASFFNMTQGDNIVVNMSGWANSPYGENLSIIDRTSGQSSQLNLWDFAGNFPLNPSYATNSYENGLQWTPGGEYPVGFAFEIGHAGNYNYPYNNSYGGCSPGKPPATALYPSVPCPSYDPQSWSNDTLQPWKIAAPTFFNAGGSETPSQVAFTQDFGGVGAISDIGEGACDGQLGSAWCSYPWYSYSCADRSFTYGATNYPGVTDDFGKFYQFSQVLESNGLGFGYFPPTNFSIPDCGQTSYSASIGTSGLPGGSVYFLSQSLSSATTVSGLLPGSYSIYPIAPPTGAFLHWITTGGLSVLGAATDPWATLVVTGTGFVTAVFTPVPVLTTVTFADTGATSHGSIVVSPARTYTDGLPLANVAHGGSLNLSPGVYGIQALPPPGSAFTQWTTSGSAISVSAARFPYANLDVTGAGGTVTLTAVSTPTSDLATVYYGVSGAGNMTLNGVATNSGNVTTMPVGARPVAAIPDPGWTFAGWSYGPSGVMTDFSTATNATFENGTSFLYAYFSPIPVAVNVTLDDSPSNGGAIGFASAPQEVVTPNPSGTVAPTTSGRLLLFALPAAGYNFTGWSVNNSSAAWVYDPVSSVSWALFNASATVTASYVAAPSGSVHFVISPAAGGSVGFNGLSYSNGTVNSSVATGVYYLIPVPNPGYELWSGLGLLVNGSGSLVFTPAGWALAFSGTGSATVVVPFIAIPTPSYPVTFSANSPMNPPDGVTVLFNGTTSWTEGTTLWLRAGVYTIDLSASGAFPSSSTFLGWDASPGLSFGSSAPLSTTLNVTGPGTFSAIIAPELTVSLLDLPTPTDVGLPITFTGWSSGSAPFTYGWSGLPTGCAAADASTIVCIPTAAGVYSVTLQATDSIGRTGYSETVAVPVNDVVAVSVTASPLAVDEGIPTTITTTVTGGTQPLTYDYTTLPSGCAGNTASFVCVPTFPSTAGVTVGVTDALGVGSTGAAPLVVNPLPVVTDVSAVPAITDVGVATRITTTLFGGTPPISYAYTGLPAGCVSSDTAALDCVPTATGISTVTVTATDAFGMTTTGNVTVAANIAPSVGTFTATRALLDVGMTTVLSTSATGGTGTLTLSYVGLPSGCASVNAPTISCTPRAVGIATVVVTASDAAGGHASQSLLLTVNALPSITTASFSSEAITQGDSVTLSVAAGGGTGMLAYAYSGLPAGCPSLDAPTITCTPTASGDFVVNVTVTDELGQSSNGSATLSVAAPAASGPFGLGSMGYLALGLIAALVVAVVVFAVWRMRRATPPASSPPTPTWSEEAPTPTDDATPADPAGPDP